MGGKNTFLEEIFIPNLLKMTYFCFALHFLGEGGRICK